MTSLPPLQTCEVLGTPLAVIDYEGAVARATAWAKEATETRCVAAAASHLVTVARHEEAFARTLTKFDLILPDGMPLIWVMNRCLRHTSATLADRVYGPTFMLRCLAATQGAAWSHYFVGGSKELLARLQENLLAKFPELRIAGVFSPPFGSWSRAENDEIINGIRNAGAKFVWIGLGCPKQENWLAEHKAQLPPAVYSTVGAAFAFHAGQVRQAPMWMQRRGLEWLFRVCSEPRRLFTRYLYFNSLFLWYLLRDSLFPVRR